MALQAYMPALQGAGHKASAQQIQECGGILSVLLQEKKEESFKARMLKRRMIKLLEKLLSQRDGIHSEYGALLRYTQDYHKRLSIIRKVLVQEKEMFEGRKVSDRIVSIDRHYVRPIVRGKETKSVEFGAKVNNIQIDGISFIEHLSFKAFNEGIRLKDCIRMQQKLMNVRVRCVAADSIYANNANRKFCTKYGISTSFVRKGRAAKDEPLRKVLRSELSKERATRLEGSFGTQKQHYSLSRIKARNRKTEILWIFFGIHTANAILMIEKIRNKQLKQHDMILLTESEEVIRLLPNVMSCRIEVCEKARKNDNKNGI